MSDGVNEDLVRHIAHLSRLSMSEQEVQSMARELSAIVAYVDQLRELDTSEIEETAHALGARNVFREDVVEPSFDAERSLQNAPQREGAFFRVPKVLGRDGEASP